MLNASVCACGLHFFFFRYALFTGRWPDRALSTATFVRDLLPNVKLPDDCEAHHTVNGTASVRGQAGGEGWGVGVMRGIFFEAAMVLKHHPPKQRA